MKVLIACGGTAGHIFPGLALAEELKRKVDNCQIVLVVSDHLRDRRYLKAGSSILKGVSIERLGSIALPYKFSFKYIPFGLKLFWALLKSFFIILRYSPQMAVGFGGYASFAPLVAARIRGIPTLIHEQNVRPGRANKLLARIVDEIAVSFDNTDNFFLEAKSRHRIIKTGFPLRRHILTYSADRLKQLSGRFTILVLGGSQGAHRVNELVLDCLKLMDEKELRRIRLLHLTGKGDFDYVKQRYKALDVVKEVFDFLEDMASAYKMADLLISRCGAGTIFEAAHFGLPCILIPYAGGTKHQKDNAAYLECRGAALSLDEERASCEDLKKILLKLLTERKMREELSQRIKILDNPQAGPNLKEQVLHLCKSRYACE